MINIFDNWHIKNISEMFIWTMLLDVIEYKTVVVYVIIFLFIF